MRIEHGKPSFWRSLAITLIPLTMLLGFGFWQLAPEGEDDAVPELLAFSGRTMGTSFQVLLGAGWQDLEEIDPDSLEREIGERLDYLDRRLLSTYASDSQLSRFNAWPAGQPMSAAPELVEIIALARQAYLASGGAFDPSVKPLVDLWGFGAGGGDQAVPPPAAIEAARRLLDGAAAVIGPDQASLLKTRPVQLDLSAIAKGYAAEQIALLLEAQGAANYLVEIGGEVFVQGEKAPGHPWQLAIEAPRHGQREAFQPLNLSGRRAGAATSGEYRNYFHHQGRRYSHVISPFDGWPTSHELVSVTVIADSAALADAFATALMALGEREGTRLAEELQLAAFFIRLEGGELKSSHSPAFAPYLAR